MSTMATSSVKPTDVSPDDGLEIEEKKIVPPPTISDGDVEVGVTEEPVKTYYSKLSVWLMVLFSGLAIGSDG